MNHLKNPNPHVVFTDQLERQLIQEEIGRLNAFNPTLGIASLFSKIAALFRSERTDDVALDNTRTA